MGPELVGLKANEWTYKRGIYAPRTGSVTERPERDAGTRHSPRVSRAVVSWGRRCSVRRSKCEMSGFA
eukprot:COSAG06_NODE_68095_length_240_cov_10.773050_1_plen_67_part_10